MKFESNLEYTMSSLFSFLKYLFLILPVLMVPVSGVQAQVDERSELFHALAENDSLLFVEGFNKCNREKFEGLMAADLEFYHDTGGFQDREDFFIAYSNNICSGSEKKPIRKLIPGTLMVFELRDNGEIYGAIQRGEHEFYIKEPDKEMYKTSFARFTHLWLLEDGEWILKRVLSYDHKDPE